MLYTKDQMLQAYNYGLNNVGLEVFKEEFNIKEEMEKDAKMMGHSKATQQAVYTKSKE